MADLFGQNFQFYTGKKQQSKKNTSVGMFFTVFIVIVTFSYLGWLIDGLANNKFLPKVNIQSHLFDETDSKFQFKNLPPLVFSYEFDDGVPENFNFNDYFDMKVYHGNKGEDHLVELNWGQCLNIYPELHKELKFQEYEYCIDHKNLFLDFEKPKYNIKVMFTACSDKPNCKPLDEIYQMVEDFPVDIKPFQILQEVSYKSKSLITTRQKYHLKGGKDIVHAVTAAARKSNLLIDDGLFLSTYSEQSYIYQVDMLSQSYDRSLVLEDPYFEKSFMILDYELIENGKLLVVEYPKLPEMLAQANSVFITLLAVTGLTVKMISKVKIQQTIVDIHINYYYTGLKKILFKQDPLRFNETQNTQFSTVSSMIPYIKKFFFKQEQKLNENQKNEDEEKQQQNPENCSLTKEKIYDQVHEVAVKNMELRQIYREILELKTQVQLLYDDQAYSAVRYCQRSFIDPYKMYDSKEKAYQKANHLEKMDLIDRYEDINQQIFQKFLNQQQEQQQQTNNSSITYPLRSKAQTSQNYLNTQSLVKPIQKQQQQQITYNDFSILKQSIQHKIKSRIYNCLDEQIINKYKIVQENEVDNQFLEMSSFQIDNSLTPTSVDQSSNVCTSRLGQYILPAGDIDQPDEQKF